MNQSPSSSTRSSRALLMASIFLIAANLRAPITSVGPVLDNIVQSLGLSLTQASLLNALPLLVYAVLSPLSVKVARVIGLERTLWAALVLVCIGTVMRSFAEGSYLWSGTLLLSGGIAFCNVLLPGLVKRDFPQKAALCIGLYAAIMSVMAGVASAIAVPLAQSSPWGWRFAVGVWAIPSLITVLVWLPRLSQRSAPMTANAQSSRSPWRSAIGWQVSLFMALLSMIFYALIGWFTSFASARGISAETAGYYLFVYQVVAVAANLLTIPLLRKSKDQQSLGLICSLFTVVGVAGLLWWPAISLIWLICAGIGLGMSWVVCLTLLSLRTSHHSQAAALSGMAQCVGYSLGAAGPLLVGILHELTGGWHTPMVFLLVMALLQGVFAVLAGRARVIE